jgi:hypothetical protein
MAMVGGTTMPPETHRKAVRIHELVSPKGS